MVKHFFKWNAHMHFWVFLIVPTTLGAWFVRQAPTLKCDETSYLAKKMFNNLDLGESPNLTFPFPGLDRAFRRGQEGEHSTSVGDGFTLGPGFHPMPLGFMHIPRLLPTPRTPPPRVGLDFAQLTLSNY